MKFYVSLQFLPYWVGSFILQKTAENSDDFQPTTNQLPEPVDRDNNNLMQLLKTIKLQGHGVVLSQHNKIFSLGYKKTNQNIHHEKYSRKEKHFMLDWSDIIKSGEENVLRTFQNFESSSDLTDKCIHQIH